MQRNLINLVLILLLISCKNEPNQPAEQAESKETTTEVKRSFPNNLDKVFEAHGGYELWQTMNGLVFGMDRPNGSEITLTNLKSRHALIETPNYKLGYNGEQLWVKETDTVTYKGNAKFYNGLMFYFYAMPFVLSDNGIIYEDAPALNYDGVEYPGILISYNSGVGVSPEDQYILYYHPETYEMAWLAYTVTFGKDEKSSNFRYIRYHDWQMLKGLKLPKAISWFKVEDGAPTEIRNTLEFVDAQITKSQPNEVLFQPEEGATIIE